jgi:hypothetical protein
VRACFMLVRVYTPSSPVRERERERERKRERESERERERKREGKREGGREGERLRVRRGRRGRGERERVRKRKMQNMYRIVIFIFKINDSCLDTFYLEHQSDDSGVVIYDRNMFIIQATV